MTLTLILLGCIIGYFLIKYWIKFVNIIFKPFERIFENKQVVNQFKQLKIKATNTESDRTKFEENEKETQNSIKTTKDNAIELENEITDLGIFIKNNHIKKYLPEYQKEYLKKQFYFLSYDKTDGEWVKKGDPLCYVYTFSSDTIYSYPPVFTPKSGYLEHTKKKGESLFEGDDLSIIHDKGKYKNENIIENNEYNHYFQGICRGFEKWFVIDGNFVKKGENIYQYHYANNNLETHKAEKNGYIDICDPSKIVSIEKNELMYVIRENDKLRIEQKFKNEPNIVVDDFTNSKIIKWERVSIKPPYTSEGVESVSDDNLIDLLFSFNFNKSKDYIIFHFNPKQTKPKLNDKISFLFENNEQIDFLININPISTKNSCNQKIVECKSLITKSELDIFASQKFKKWKLSLTDDGKEILGGEAGGRISCYKSKSNLIIVINKFAKEYIELVKNEIKDYKPTELRTSKKTSISKDEFCYVYLMQDTSNGYFKIGISNKPKYRERTLQSEKPTIELIASKKFPIRKIAESFEKSLHETYSDKRIRGEWFELNEQDIEYLKESLK